MFIHSKGNYIIKDKGEVFKIPIEFIGTVPSWVEKNWYFQALIKDGKISTFNTTSDKEINQSIAKSEAKGKVRELVAAEQRIVDDKIGQAMNEVEEEAKKNHLDQTAIKNLTKKKVEEKLKKR